MLQSLADPILPIFAVLMVGFVLCKQHVVDAAHATQINRFVFFIGTPALVFAIIVRTPLDDLNVPVLASYFFAECVIYAAIAIVSRSVFRLSLAESLLLGMTAVFSNHVFFVRPIAILALGNEAASPIAGIILIDLIVFCGTVMLVEAATSQDKGIAPALKKLSRNPFVYAPALGIPAWWVGDSLPSGIMTFADFAGGAAAPVSMFALGVVLATINLRPVGILVFVVVGAKLCLHPGLVFLLSASFESDTAWSYIGILVAAGPCGAMPFVIALQYGVETKRIAIAVLFSTVLSLFTLSFILQTTFS